MILALDGGPDPTTIVMTAHNNVFDFESIDGVLDSGHEIAIGPNDKVGHIARDKDCASVFPHDFVGRDTGIRAACCCCCWWCCDEQGKQPGVVSSECSVV